MAAPRQDGETTILGYGVIVSVEDRRAGTQLVGTHTAPVSVLHVADTSCFPDLGGSVLVAGDTLAYSSATDTDDPDFTAAGNVDQTDTLTLTAPTVNTYPSGTQVVLDPPRDYRMALVVLDGATQPIEARITHGLIGAEGPRQDGEGEVVLVEQRDDELGLVITDVIGTESAAEDSPDLGVEDEIFLGSDYIEVLGRG